MEEWVSSSDDTLRLERLRRMLSSVETEFERLLATNRSLEVEISELRMNPETPEQPNKAQRMSRVLSQELREPGTAPPKPPPRSYSGGAAAARDETKSGFVNVLTLPLPLVASSEASGASAQPSPSGSRDLPMINRSSQEDEQTPLGSERLVHSCSSLSMQHYRSEEALQLAPAWYDRSSRMQRSISRSSSKNLANECLQIDVKRAGDALRSKSWVQRFISRPSSLKRIFWDLLSVTVMAYDLVTIPLEFFELPDSVASYAMSLLTTCFWSTDIFISFSSGYHAGGLIEMRPKQVALNYLRTWFCIDVLVVSIDWTVIGVDSNSMDTFGVIRLNKTLRIVRILRVLRMLRLLRMLKVMSVISELQDMIHSESVLTALKIVSFIIGIMLLSHYIACAWYGVGFSQISEGSDPRDSWVSRLKMGSGIEPGPESTAYYYATALHWSLTQFTPASMEVVPCNTPERLFTIGVIVISVIIFSSVLSTITAAMINLRRKSEEKRKQVTLVRRYIMDKKVTLALGNRVVGFLRQHNYNVNTRQSLQEGNIPAFQILPDSLKAQLRCEVYLPSLVQHPLFFIMKRIDESAIFGVCVSAMSELELHVGQEMFAVGKRASQMLVLVLGSLTYYVGDQMKLHEDVDPGTFISEAVLWVVWEHRGRLVATGACDLIAMKAEAFHKVMSQAVSRPLCRIYALKFREVLLNYEENDLDLLTDIGEVDQDMYEMSKASYAKWSEVSEIGLMSFEEIGFEIDKAAARSSLHSVVPDKSLVLGMFERALSFFRPNRQAGVF